MACASKFARCGSIVLFSAACTPTLDPDFDLASATSVLYAIRSENNEEVQFIAASTTNIAGVVQRDASVDALLFRESLESLQITAGPISHVPEGPRSLPAPVASYTRRDDAWIRTDEPDPTSLSLRLAALDAVRCADDQGCVAIERSVCSIPCLERTAFEAPALPEPPNLDFPPSPRLCDDSSDRVEDEAGVVVCVPRELPPRVVCSAHEMQLYGAADCEAIGPACAADGWPSDLPADRTIVYVLAGAMNGNGDRATPFGTIAAAVAAAPAGAIVAVAAGVYADPLTLDRPIEIRGACESGTELVIADSVGIGVQILADVALSDLEITGAFDALNVERGQLELRRVSISAGAGRGLITLEDTDLDAERVVIRDRLTAGMILRGRRSKVSDLIVERVGSHGIVLDETETATLSRFVVSETVGQNPVGLRLTHVPSARIEFGDFVDTRVHAITAIATTSVTFGHISIRDVQQPLIDSAPSAFLVLDGHVSIHGLRIERIDGKALELVNAGADTTDVIIRDTEGTGLDGAGVVAVQSKLRMSGTSIINTGWNAMFFRDGTYTFEDLSIADLPRRVDSDTSGRGIWADSDIVISINRGAFSRLGRAALLFEGMGTFENIAMIDISEAPSTSLHDAAFSMGRGTASVHRLRLERCLGRGVGISNPSTFVAFSDVLAIDCGHPAVSTVGIEFGATASVDRMLIEGAPGSGFDLIGECSQANVRDLTVRGGVAEDHHGSVSARSGSILVADRVLVEGNLESGLRFLNPGRCQGREFESALRNVTVQNNDLGLELSDKARLTMTTARFQVGHNIGVVLEGAVGLEVDHFVFRGEGGTAIDVLPNTTEVLQDLGPPMLRLHDGEIAGFDRGMTIDKRVEGLELITVFDRVSFTDNVVNVESTSSTR